jgi:hypothetical protein
MVNGLQNEIYRNSACCFALTSFKVVPMAMCQQQLSVPQHSSDDDVTL